MALKDTHLLLPQHLERKQDHAACTPSLELAGTGGEFKQVIAYTNCEEVYLYLNDRPVGRRGYDFPNVGAVRAWNGKAKYTDPTTHDCT